MIARKWLNIQLLLQIFFVNRGEFWDRIKRTLEGYFDRVHVNPSSELGTNVTAAVQSLEQFLDRDLVPIMTEQAAVEMEKSIVTNIGDLTENAPFELQHNADMSLARFCYLICRASRPKVVIETGVAYGVTSTAILHALSVNKKGGLYSVDLPPLGRCADEYVGRLVPQALRDRWHLHRGASERILPVLFSQLRSIDVFVHDALHTYRSMRSELWQMWSHLRLGGVLVADDVHRNGAFAELVEEARPSFSVIVLEEEKDALFGVAIK